MRVAALDPLEVGPESRRAAQRLPVRLGDQLAHDRRPLAGDVSQPVLVPRLVLARDQPEIPPHRPGVAKALRVINERGRRLGGAGANPGMVRSWATADVCCACWFSACSIRRIWRRSVSIPSRSRSRRNCCETVGNSSCRSQARPCQSPIATLPPFPTSAGDRGYLHSFKPTTIWLFTLRASVGSTAVGRTDARWMTAS